jgi:thiol:disulfide interchange protein DsbC
MMTVNSAQRGVACRSENMNTRLASAKGIALLALLLVVGASRVAAQVEPAVEEQIRERLTVPAMGLYVESVEASEMKGFYRVQFTDGPEVYATASGEYFIVGDIYNVGPSGVVNLGEQRRAADRRARLAKVAKEDQIVFPAEGETRAYISVFTDVSCFYCQKLHKEVPELNSLGIEVRYLAYPRQGIGSEGFRQLATAWCADDRQTTLTRMKNREQIDDAVCAGNPVAEQFELGQAVGVRGTPAIVTADGQLIPGYRTVDQLLGDLGLQ